MGQLKALLRWEERPLLVYQTEQMLASSVERVAVVLGHRAGELALLLPADERIVVVENPDYRSGKVSSILAGVRAAPADAATLIVGVDQPRPAALVEGVVRAHRSRVGMAITIAAYAGRRGHPLLISGGLREEVLAIEEASEGLRAVLQRHRDHVFLYETGSPLALLNLNTLEDYAAALRLTSSSSSALAGNQ